MPTKIYFKGGANVQVKGDSDSTALHQSLLGRLTGRAQAVAMNGHELKFKMRNVLCREYQPEAEHKEEQEKLRKAQEAQAAASHCRRCKKPNPPEADFCMNCSAPLVKKEPPRNLIPSN